MIRVQIGEADFLYIGILQQIISAGRALKAGAEN